MAREEGNFIFVSGVAGECPGQTGVYGAAIEDGALTLTVVDDPCTSRVAWFEPTFTRRLTGRIQWGPATMSRVNRSSSVSRLTTRRASPSPTNTTAGGEPCCSWTPSSGHRPRSPGWRAGRRP